MANLIKDITLSSATSATSLSNLNIQKGELYEITISIPSGSSGAVGFTINSNNTESNYQGQRFEVGGTTRSAERFNSYRVFGNITDGAMNQGYIKLSNTGHFIFQSFSFYALESTIWAQQWFVKSNFTVTSITQLELRNIAGSNLPIGTRIQLRKVGEKIYDYEVPAATTNVVLSDLNIKKDDEYLLVSDIVCGSSDSAIYLTFNNNNTLTNYYEQELVATGTSLFLSRPNNPRFSTANTSRKSLSIANIKLTNNNYCTFQSKVANQYDGSNTIRLEQYYGTSTFQTTKIDSLKITSSAANGLGAGSRFELYKLYEEPLVEPDPDTYELLAEITVYSPTTQIDIPVNITKDDEVLLSCTIKNDASGTNRNYWLFVNNDTTATNYWTQYLNGSGSSIGAARFNAVTWLDTNNTAQVLTKIKISNNDRVVFQTNVASHGIGANASGIRNNNWNTINTTTISTITSVQIVSQVANAIGVGSKIQLFKVN